MVEDKAAVPPKARPAAPPAQTLEEADRDLQIMRRLARIEKRARAARPRFGASRTVFHMRSSRPFRLIEWRETRHPGRVKKRRTGLRLRAVAALLRLGIPGICGREMRPDFLAQKEGDVIHAAGPARGRGRAAQGDACSAR
ncbi:hypothetical protein SmB9_00070 [Sphingosinicella microcystinivorans]|uniref:Uncharacterized protein n=1 Tax=Sphingosinicella microcystinivorans TaxID=335406 RepID=A0AAD1D2S5_SPHMI|nr:hypothetical protein SmB9_00070 [Sphingosinicella microcystinivorans]